MDREKLYVCLVVLFKAVGASAAVALWLALYVFLLITFFIETGWFRGVGGWVGLCLFVYCLLILPFIILYIFRNHYYSPGCTSTSIKEVDSKEQRPNNGNIPVEQKALRAGVCVVIGYFFILILTQIVLVFVNPVDGIFPLAPLNADAFAASEYRPAGCDVAIRYAEAVSFFENSTVKASRIPVVYGGMPGHFGSASAMVIDSAIYLEFHLCPSVNLLVHEIVHLWQIQTGWWFEQGAALYWSVFFARMQCADCPYEYGGLQGLQASQSASKTFHDFGPEQQARIVQDYYILLSSQATSSSIFPLLKDYAQAVLADNLL